MGEIFGLKAEMDFESRTLKLLQTEPSLTNITDGWTKNEREDVLAQSFDDVQVLAYELEPQSLTGAVKDDESADEDADISETTEGAVYDDVIEIPKLSVRKIDLGGLPVLTQGNIVYLPIKALTGENGFGWDVYYDPYTGIYVSTKEGVSAKSYWDEAESKYNQGLVNYVMKLNGNYTPTKAQELIFMFKTAADTYKIDERVLMAVAQKESTFNARCGEKNSGALGMMQVMPSTGARYGLGREQLLDAETSINFGAMYLSERIAAYGGDMTKGFSAYNQGSVAVNRGSYSTRYASRVIDTINGINSYLTANGYGLGN
ncbi:MAG TPA: transglycosylase SLT domain-containing protein [Bacillota bacterium]|nr:transglycosylase SLT domain-containing protein [Bacillota bacterium]